MSTASTSTIPGVGAADAERAGVREGVTEGVGVPESEPVGESD
jgi:hypothetical protein